jgi:hypothetical protein
MTPPSLEVAREILADAAANARASGDPFNEIAAAAIDVVLAQLVTSEAVRSEVVKERDQLYATLHGTAIPPDALVAEMLPCPFCGRADVLHVEPFPGSDWPAVRCRACLCIGPPPRPEGRDQRGATASWNRRKPVTGLDAQTLRALGRSMGFGRLMQEVEWQWRHVLGHAGAGEELTVGPRAALLVPCICAAAEPCDWCGGSRRITARVRDAIPIAVG